MIALAKKLVEAVLDWAARRTLAVQRPTIVGVTGSSGKTTTKSAIGHLLKNTIHDREIRIAAGNLNTELGLPLVILDLPKPEGKLAWAQTTLAAITNGLMPAKLAKPLVLVLEYGADQPGDIKHLVTLARPDIAVVTNVGYAHTALLGSLDGVAREKAWLVRALPKMGIAILNADDLRVRALAKRTEGNVVEVRAPVAELSE